MRNIGLADQLGSGVRNIFKCSRLYSGKEPQFIENDVFRIIVPLDSERKNTTQTTQSTTQTGAEGVEQQIFECLKKQPDLSQKRLAEQLGMDVNTVKYYIRRLKQAGKIEHQGSRRTETWIVKEK